METGKEVDQPRRDIPQWDEDVVTIAAKKGPREVRCLVNPWCPGLAVTMADFGEFEVTHRASGLRLGGRYERMGSACIEAAEWAAIARMAGVTWEVSDCDVLRAAMLAVADKAVPFGGETETDEHGRRRISVRSWIGTVKSNSSWDEFPWESSDEHPLSRADVVLATLAPAETPTPPASAPEVENA